MKAVVFHGVGDIRLDTVDDPRIETPTDAILKITGSAICGTDLHMVRGTMPGMKPGTILGHEAVGVIEEVGKDARNLRVGDRVVVPSTIGCGSCSYCRDGYYAQCDTANPNGSRAGTSFFGGPEMTGPFNGLQAEYARIPYANVGLYKLPEGLSDDKALMISDIFPTGYFGAELAEVGPGDVVAVFGCGPVGLFAIVSAFQMGASRVLAVDALEDRLKMASAQGAETIDFSREDPVETILSLTGGIGADRIIDAVGVDAYRATNGEDPESERHAAELRAAAPETNPHDGNWAPGNAPSQALDWAVDSVAKAGSIGIIGVYPPTFRSFPIGMAMNRNLTMNMGNCNHRRYLPHLVSLCASGVVDPERILTKKEPMSGVLDAYGEFDRRQPGWMKVALEL